MDDQEKYRSENIEKIRRLINKDETSIYDVTDAVALGQTVLHETLGDRHPLMNMFNLFVKKPDWNIGKAACKALVTLYNQNKLVNPRLQIAREIEEEVIIVAEQQWKEAEKEEDQSRRQIRLSLAAFLCGAALEDALRRLCDKHLVSYDLGKTTISKLQTELYSPSRGVEIITRSENSRIGSWAQTRNNADHGHFSRVTTAEVQAMIAGTRELIEKYLP